MKSSKNFVINEIENIDDLTSPSASEEEEDEEKEEEDEGKEKENEWEEERMEIVESEGTRVEGREGRSEEYRGVVPQFDIF